MAENGRHDWDERFILYVLGGSPKSSNTHLLTVVLQIDSLASV